MRVQLRTWTAYVETAEKGRAIAEVAEELDMPAGSVSQAKYSVAEKLRVEVEKLERSGPSESRPPEAGEQAEGPHHDTRTRGDSQTG